LVQQLNNGAAKQNTNFEHLIGGGVPYLFPCIRWLSSVFLNHHSDTKTPIVWGRCQRLYPLMEPHDREFCCSSPYNRTETQTTENSRSPHRGKMLAFRAAGTGPNPSIACFSIHPSPGVPSRNRRKFILFHAWGFWRSKPPNWYVVRTSRRLSVPKSIRFLSSKSFGGVVWTVIWVC